MCWIIYCAIILRCVDSELLKLWAQASWFWIFIFYMLWILVPINIIVIQYTWISVDCTIQIKALVIGCLSNEWGIDFCSTASGSNSLLQRLKYYSHKFVELHFAYIAEAWIRYVFLAINALNPFWYCRARASKNICTFYYCTKLTNQLTSTVKWKCKIECFVGS